MQIDSLNGGNELMKPTKATHDNPENLKAALSQPQPTTITIIINPRMIYGSV